MSRKVYIRVNKDSSIGHGHWMRCTALAESLVRAFPVTFVTDSTPQIVDSKSPLEGVNVFPISSEMEFYDVLDERSIVVLDGYNFGPDYIERLKCYSRTIVSIQDGFRFAADISLIINHLVNAHEFSEYESLSGTKLLAGPMYALIRSEFLFPAENNPIPNSFVISLGGTVNFETINALSEIIFTKFPNAVLNIITSSANYDSVRFGTKHINLSPSEVVAILDKSEYCLVTPGMSSYEAMSRNRKIILGSLNAGQHEMALQFASSMMCSYIGFWKDFTVELFTRLVETEIVTLGRQDMVFDRDIKNRILREFIKL